MDENESEFDIKRREYSFLLISYARKVVKKKSVGSIYNNISSYGYISEGEDIVSHVEKELYNIILYTLVNYDLENYNYLFKFISPNQSSQKKLKFFGDVVDALSHYSDEYEEEMKEVIFLSKMYFIDDDNKYSTGYLYDRTMVPLIWYILRSADISFQFSDGYKNPSFANLLSNVIYKYLIYPDPDELDLEFIEENIDDMKPYNMSREYYLMEKRESDRSHILNTIVSHANLDLSKPLEFVEEDIPRVLEVIEMYLRLGIDPYFILPIFTHTHLVNSYDYYKLMKEYDVNFYSDKYLDYYNNVNDPIILNHTSNENIIIDEIEDENNYEGIKDYYDLDNVVINTFFRLERYEYIWNTLFELGSEVYLNSAIYAIASDVHDVIINDEDFYNRIDVITDILSKTDYDTDDVVDVLDELLEKNTESNKFKTYHFMMNMIELVKELTDEYKNYFKRLVKAYSVHYGRRNENVIDIHFDPEQRYKLFKTSLKVINPDDARGTMRYAVKLLFTTLDQVNDRLYKHLIRKLSYSSKDITTYLLLIDNKLWTTYNPTYKWKLSYALSYSIIGEQEDMTDVLSGVYLQVYNSYMKDPNPRVVEDVRGYMLAGNIDRLYNIYERSCKDIENEGNIANLRAMAKVFDINIFGKNKKKLCDAIVLKLKTLDAQLSSY